MYIYSTLTINTRATYFYLNVEENNIVVNNVTIMKYTLELFIFYFLLYLQIYIFVNVLVFFLSIVNLFQM